jgi:hypothetical protein
MFLLCEKVISGSGFVSGSDLIKKLGGRIRFWIDIGPFNTDPATLDI